MYTVKVKYESGSEFTVGKHDTFKKALQEMSQYQKFLKAEGASASLEIYPE